MNPTRAVTTTGNRYIDGLLGGTAWSDSLSFSFPNAASDYEATYGSNEPTTGFGQLSLAQMQVARIALLGETTVPGGAAVLKGIGVASFTNLEVVDAGFDGADMRLAQSRLPPTAWARLPGEGSAGDVWFGTGYNYRNPVLGDYAYHTILHEIGHALGLKHSHEAGGVANVVVPADRDSIEFTLMSYRSYVGAPATGYTYEQYGAPQSFMMLDIAALQVMYGADFTANAGDTTYRWSPTTGEMSVDGVGQGRPGANRVFLTIWDGNGRDTYDFSAYGGGVKVNLAPGGWSITSNAQLASLGNGKQARGNVFNAMQYQGDERSLIEDAIGGTGADSIAGNDAANRLQGGGGSDTMAGGLGADTLDGGTGADSLSGGAGDDLYIISETRAAVLESAGQGIDRVRCSASWTMSANVEELLLTGDAAIDGTGSSGADTITGNGAANRLAGGAGNDLLTGNAGADTLDAGLGADTLAGGTGDDLYIVAATTQRIVEQPGEGTDSVRSLVTWTLGDDLEHLVLLGTSAINAIGNAADNSLAGNSGANLLSGGAGDDTLSGEAGADTLDGGTGDDVMAGGAGSDVYRVDAAGDTVTEATGGGIDTVLSDITIALGSEVELLRLQGTAALDGTGNALANGLYGNAGANGLDGGLGADTLDGGAGADTLDGGAGIDSMLGGAGDDLFLVDDTLDRVSEGSGGGADTVIAGVTFTLTTNVELLLLTGEAAIDGTGSGGADTIIGNGAANRLAGGAGNDLLTGNAGADTLDAGLGADTLAGGTGDDLYIVAATTQRLVEQPGEGTDSVRSLVTWTLGDDLEHLVLLGTSAINAIGNAADNSLAGNSGTNLLSGGAGDDTLSGEAGADTLDGGTGDDVMAGGAGNDVYRVDAAGDTVTEATGGGIDTVLSDITIALGSEVELLRLQGTAALDGTGNALANGLYGNAGANDLDGGLGADTLDGGAGADTLDGGAGIDSMLGGAGDDIFLVDDTLDRISESVGAGADTVVATVSFTLAPYVEGLVLAGSDHLVGTGNGDLNSLLGNAGNNLLSGLGSADTLIGGGGTDTLLGGAGADLMEGGAGADIFRFGAATEGGDTIADFDADDLLQFSAGAFGGGLTLGMDLLAAGRLQISASGAAVGTLAQFVFSTDTHRLSWDSNGTATGGLVFLAELTDATPDASDFVVIA